MKKILITISILLGLSGVAYAAPTLIYQRTLLPETDSTYNLGSSTNRWANIYTDDLVTTDMTVDSLTATLINASTTNSDVITVGSYVNYPLTLGTSSPPELQFEYDTNTGLGWIADDKMGLYTGGTSRLTIDASGNVGIGTTTVNSRFVVEGGGGNILDLFDSVGAAKVTVLNDGNVGIGTTAPGVKLEIVDGGTNTQTIARITTYNDDTDYPSELDLFKSHNDVFGTLTPTIDTEYLGVIRFSGVDSGSVKDVGAVISAVQDGAAGVRLPTNLIFETYSSTGRNTNQLVLHNDGNVGIGTTAPSNIFHISQSNSGAYTEALIENTAVSGAAGFEFKTNTHRWKTGVNINDDYRIRDETNNANVFTIEDGAGANAFYIKSGGNVGIGTTSPDSAAKLDVNGKIKLGLSSNEEIFSDGSIRFDIDNNNDQTDRAFLFSHHTNVELMRIQENGNVGIGDTSPDAMLNVERQSGGNETLFMVGTSTDSDIFVIKSTGNVGIGTTTPLKTFHIVTSNGNLGLLEEHLAPNSSGNGRVEYVFIGSSENAVIDLVSGSSGGHGSGIELNELVNGTTTDKWWIGRETSGEGAGSIGNSDFTIYYSSEQSGYLGTSTAESRFLTLTKTGRLGVGYSLPEARIHSLVADTKNMTGLKVTQQDTTNNPLAAFILNEGTGNGLKIDQNGNVGQVTAEDGALFIENTHNSGIGLGVYSNMGATADGALASIVVDNVAFDQNVLQIQNDGVGRGMWLDNNNIGLVTQALLIQDASTSGGNQSVKIESARTGGSAIAALEIEQTGSAAGILIDQNGNGYSLNIDSEATTAKGIYGNFQVMTSGDALTIEVDSDLLTGDAIRILGSTDHATNVFNIDALGNGYFAGYASSTTGLFTQGNGHIGGDLTVDGTINGADYGFANGWLLTENFKLDKDYKGLTFLDENGNEVFEITKDGAEYSESERIKTLEARIEALENRVGLIERFINWIRSL